MVRLVARLLQTLALLLSADAGGVSHRGARVAAKNAPRGILFALPGGDKNEPTPAPHTTAEPAQEAELEEKAPDNPGGIPLSPSEVVEHASHVASKIQDAPVAIPKQMHTDGGKLYDNFLPGFDPDVRILHTSLAMAAGTIIWFTIWTHFIYKQDRDKVGKAKEALSEYQVIHGENWEKDLVFGVLDSAKFPPSPTDVPADIVIVFPNPGFVDDGKVADEGPTIPISVVDIICPPHRGKGKHTERAFRKVAELMEPIRTSTFASDAADTIGAGQTVAALTEPGPSAKELTVALIQDLYAVLPEVGFDTTIFKSIDDDELFMTISMRCEVWAKHYLHTTSMELQVTDAAAEKLLPGAVEEAFKSPPFLRFDPFVIERLHEQGIIPTNDATSLFQAGESGDKDFLINNLDRIKIIRHRIERLLDLNLAKKQGLIVDWFPAHNPKWLKRIAVTWSQTRTWFDLSFSQPIPLLHSYFGPHRAFCFGWNGMYCKALLALVPVAIFSELAHSFAGFRQIIAFSLILVLWCRMTNNLWEREQGYFCKLWNLDPDENATKTILPEFHGTLQASPIDNSKKEIIYAPWKSRVRLVISALITIAFCAAAAACIFLWVSIFQGRMDLFASLSLTVQIKIFDFIFQHLAEMLTQFENNKYEKDYYEHLLWKLFAFQFVNSYWAFFYLAVQQRHTVWGCPAEGCYAVLRKQLSTTLCILAVVRVVQVVVTTVMVRHKLHKEMEALREKNEADHEKTGNLKRTFEEEQAKFTDSSSREQIQQMSQLMVALGYVVLFGGIAPIIIPFCLLEFVVHIRAASFLHVTAMKRPFPMHGMSIGAWGDVVSLLQTVGVVFAGFLIVEYGDLFRGQALITRLVAVLCFVFFVHLLWQFVDLVCPPTCEDAEILGQRRWKTLKSLFTQTAIASEKIELKEHSKTHAGFGGMLANIQSAQAMGKDLRQLVETADWEHIPKGSDLGA